MADTQHTATPWHRNIKPASKYPIVFAGRNTHVLQMAISGRAPEQVEADLEFLLRAVNNHAALVEALATLTSLCESAARFMDAGGIPEVKEARSQAVSDARELLDSLRPKYIECGCCGGFHTPEYRGECRDDKHRFTADQLDSKHGVGKWDYLSEEDQMDAETQAAKVTHAP